VIVFSTFETTRELVMITAPGFAGTFLEIFSCLLEEFFELSGYHGDFFIIQILAIIFQSL